MTELDSTTDERSRKIESLLLQAIAARTQTSIAQEMGIDDSTFHRWINGESGLKRCAQLLAILDWLPDSFQWRLGPCVGAAPIEVLALLAAV